MTFLRVSAQLLLVVLTTNLANAASLTPFKATPLDAANNPVNGTDLALAHDDDLATAYSTSIVADSALGHGVRFDFDVSGFTNITELTFDMTARYRSDNFAIQELWFGPTRNVANLVTSVSSPVDQIINFGLTATTGGANVTDISNYLTVPGTLSIWVQTALGFGPGSFTQIDFFEINTDITADVRPPVVPLPAGFGFLLAGVMGLAVLGRRGGQ